MTHSDNPYDKTGKFISVSVEVLESILKTQQEILQLLKGESNAEQIGDFISEKEAMKMLGRKGTWFWMMRRDGKLPFSTFGKKVFYPKAEIEKLLNGNLRKSW
jgi:predicted DNA-binding transcriptional regulator AlpA